MNNRIEKLTTAISTKFGRLTFLREKKKELEVSKASALQEFENITKALVFLQENAMLVQDKITRPIEKLVTKAIRDVFQEDGYDFEMEVRPVKNTTSLEFYFVRNGRRYEPMDCCGYGCIDVASYALRIAIWSFTGYDKVLLLDQPFTNVSEKYLDRLGMFLCASSKDLKFQLIIITHVKKLIEYADRQFTLHKDGEDSRLTVRDKND